ncbi:thiamine-phosphate kinase [Alloalcanivorax xenomutans]|uniref:Thiamine-monophosphate kinase n=1 Tax=Alloalcanivorax xenomutans TaxID=1094342 RepID=A0A9Q3ZES7_9GAMM|nr:thiamine-phosphate kinase [Alloalcanivorax xenomutans]MCE7507209.1 thiamine-phosphate kinase [Alloalcanivorax xenomutans]
MDEFALIRRYFHHRQGEDVVLGPGDDAALLSPPAGEQLVMTLDTSVAGRHFPEDMPAADIGYRCLAVNLSDLAAMGATPRWFLLSLTLPEADPDWLRDFSAGLFELADQAGISLVGGDVTRGPLNVAIQATGSVLPGRALRRDGAQPGQTLAVTGVPGQGGLGLRHWRAGVRDSQSARHFARPRPALEWGAALAGRAGAALDVSDGLLQDLGHILSASGDLGAELVLADLPVNDELAALEAEDRWALQLSGGDDYGLLFTWPAGVAVPAGARAIGRVTDGPGVRLHYPDGRVSDAEPGGWRHFG